MEASIDLKSSKVRGYNNDYVDMRKLRRTFGTVLDLVEQVESFLDTIYSIGVCIKCCIYNMIKI